MIPFAFLRRLATIAAGSYRRSWRTLAAWRSCSAAAFAPSGLGTPQANSPNLSASAAVSFGDSAGRTEYAPGLPLAPLTVRRGPRSALPESNRSNKKGQQAGCRQACPTRCVVTQCRFYPLLTPKAKPFAPPPWRCFALFARASFANASPPRAASRLMPSKSAPTTQIPGSKADTRNRNGQRRTPPNPAMASPRRACRVRRAHRRFSPYRLIRIRDQRATLARRRGRMFPAWRTSNGGLHECDRWR